MAASVARQFDISLRLTLGTLAVWASFGAGHVCGDDALPGAAAAAESLPPYAIVRLGQTKPASPLLGVYGLVISPDGRQLATRSADQIVRVWDVASGRQLTAIDGHKDRILGLSYSRDGSWLATSSEGDDPAIRCWDPVSGKLLHTFAGGARLIAFAADGKSLTAVDRTSVTSYPLAGEKQLLRRLGSGTALAMTDDGGSVAVADSLSRTRIKLYRINARPSLQSLRGHTSTPVSAAFSANLAYFAMCADRSNEAHIWSLQAVPTHFALSGHTGPLQAVAISPDSRHLATASWDKTVRIWELSTRKTIAILEGHHDHVCAVAFSADGRRLASGAAGDGDTTALIWNVQDAMFPARQKLEALPPKEQAMLLEQLAAADPVVAYAIIGSMIASPKIAISLFEKRLRGDEAGAGEAEIRRLLRQLDDDDFRLREAAHRRLLELRTEADALLRGVLENSPSAEVRHRVEQILKVPIGHSTRLSDSDQRWMSRAVLALEQIDVAEGRQLLTLIAAGPAGEQHVLQAAEALKRLNQD